MELKGKVAIVTGASSGIGRQVSQDLAQAGVKLVVMARRAERLEAVEGKDVVRIAGDITDPAMPDTLLKAALDRFGQLDILINNAGIMEVAPIESIDIEKVCRMVRVNVEAAFRMAYVAVKHLKQAGRGGHVVSLSSILGTKVRANAGAYAGTKYAIEALTEGLRMELAGTGVKVSCIEPGLVDTDLQAGWPVPPKVALNIKNPLTAADVSRLIRFILEQPEFVNIPRLMVTPIEQQL